MKNTSEKIKLGKSSPKLKHIINNAKKTNTVYLNTHYTVYFVLGSLRTLAYIISEDILNENQQNFMKSLIYDKASN